MKAYMVPVLEYENGSKYPDGHVICFELEDGKKFVTAKCGHVWHSDFNNYCFANGDFIEVALNQKGVDLLKSNNGLCWTNKADQYLDFNKNKEET